MEITTIGLDLAKNVFQVHGVSSTGQVAVGKALRRPQMRRFFEQLDPCLVGIEACGSHPHRTLSVLNLELEVGETWAKLFGWILPGALVRRLPLVDPRPVAVPLRLEWSSPCVL